MTMMMMITTTTIMMMIIILLLMMVVVLMEMIMTLKSDILGVCFLLNAAFSAPVCLFV